MQLDAFDYQLPEDRIALRPKEPRSSAKMLIADGGTLIDAKMLDLAHFLRPGDHLIFNDTKVIPAQLHGLRYRSGNPEAGVDVTLAQARSDGRWVALCKPLRKLTSGDRIVFGSNLSANVTEILDGTAILEFNLSGNGFEAELALVGKMPLPPYIAKRRDVDSEDQEDYQTIFAKNPGAVAAPTASLHFDDALIDALDARGIQKSYVTLHVGAGTFLPVKADKIDDHKMHSEWGEVHEATVELIRKTKQEGGRIIPVGTTSLRILESAAQTGELKPFSGETDIFIRPGYEFRMAHGLITNFHLPKSTLLMLVSALMGMDNIQKIYAHAIKNDYRFFSYGDGSLLLP